MTKRKSTKRALLLSALSLLMCVSMLIGSTFAWFTDSVTSKNNIIKSGNLDVELYYTYDAAVAADKGSDKWEKVTKDTDIFGYELWEPGYTKVAYFMIKNEGSLELKYQLAADVYTEKEGTNQAGEKFLLSDYIMTDLVNVGATRDEILAKAGTPLKNSYSMSKGSLAAGASEVVGLAIWMPTTVGNVANHNGKDVPEITFGINLLATQKDAESDSFGPDYDEDAIYTDVVVTNEEELKEALANAREGAIIGIDGNVTWTTGAEHGSTPFVTTAKNITLVGMNEAATFTATGKGVGPIGIDNGTVTFKNLKIVDESVSYKEGSWEFGYLEFRGSTVFENCNIVNAIMMEGDSAIFKNCKFNSNKPSEYAVWVSDGDASFEGCTFTGTRGLKTHEAYGSEVGTIVVNNNKFVEISEKPGMAIGTVNADTAITLTNNEFIGTQAGDQGLYSYETDTDVTTFNFTYKDNKVVAQDSALTQGLYKVDDSTWMVTNTNALNQGISKAEAGQTVVLSQDIVYSGSGYANITKDITLDLNGNTLSTTSFGVVAKAGTIKNGVVSNPVGGRAALRTWSGVAIENVVVESPENGGITVASGNALPSIKNVTIKAKTYGIELQNYASVETIENVTIDAGENGIVVQGGTIGNITNSVIKGGKAGIYGQLKGTNDLKISVDSTNEIRGDKYGIYLCDEGANIVPDGIAYLTYKEAATIKGGLKDKEFAFAQTGKLVINGAKVGAFISTADELFAFAKKVNEEGNSFKNLTVLLTNDIDLKNAAWTPIGQTGATEFKGIFDGQGHTIKNLNVDSSAQTGEHYSSGLFGWAESNVTIKNVKVDGAKVVGNHNVSVIVGYTYSGKINNCHVSNAEIICNHANSDACGDKCGLIAGYAGDESRFTDCSASNSTVKAGRDGGQLIGAGYNVSVSNCSATNVVVSATGDCNKEANINNAVIGRVLG